MHLLRGHAGEHTGYVLDGALSENFMSALDNVRTSLPIDNEKKKTAAARRFLCANDNDFQWICPHLVHAITQSLSSNESNDENENEKNENENEPPLTEVRVLPYMRFLEYTTPNKSLGPHTDALIRCKETELWSTHTLLVFCTDVDVGGETALLPEDVKTMRIRERNVVKARVAAAKLRCAIARITADDSVAITSTTTEDCAEGNDDTNDNDDDGTTSSTTARLHRLQTALENVERRTVPTPPKPSFAVKPQRGRIFFFPHECPHEGRPTVSVPKIFLRAELILKRGST